MTKQIMVDIRRQARIQWQEVNLATMTIVWGLFLLLPFAAFQTSVGYRTMARLAPEEAWGIVLIGIGGLALLVRRQRVAQRLTTAVLTALWIAISGGFLLANPASTAAVVYGWIAVQYALLFVWQHREAH